MSPATYCLSALFLLGAAQGVRSGCAWVEHGYRSRSDELQRLMTGMGGNLTLQRAPVRFPERMYKKVQRAPMEDRIAFLSEAISNIRDVFDANLDAVTWNKTQLEHVYVVLHRQWLELQRCVRAPSRYAEGLRKHFKKLRRKVLHDMNYNLKSWELMRRQTLRHMKRLAVLHASIRTGKTE